MAIIFHSFCLSEQEQILTVLNLLDARSLLNVLQSCCPHVVYIYDTVRMCQVKQHSIELTRSVTLDNLFITPVYCFPILKVGIRTELTQ